MMQKILLLIRNVWVIMVAPIWFFIRGLTRPKATVLELTIHHHVEEWTQPLSAMQRLMGAFTGREEKTSLHDLREKVRRLRRRGHRVRQVVIKIGRLEAGWATCRSLQNIFLSIRSLEKELVVYLSEGFGMREYYVASVASKIVMAPGSTASISGISVSTPYLRSFLKQHGVEVEVFAQGTYKTAAEPLVCDSMSGAQKEQLGAIVNGLHEEVASALMQYRKLERADVEKLFRHGLWTAQEALENRLVDELLYYDQVVQEIDEEAKKEDGKETTHSGSVSISMCWHRYDRWHRAQFWREIRTRPCIAVITLHGTIAEKVGRNRLSQRVIDPAHARRLLRFARRSKNIKGVVLAINSPGGSASSSDLIHREVALLAQKKPVVACLGDVAASGGYYIAAATPTIVAQKTSLTGSIGVFSVRPHIDALMKKHSLIVETVKTAPSADLFSLFRETSDDEKVRLRAHVKATYDRFISVVSDGRKLSKEVTDGHAQGRVFLGDEAQKRNLVDQIGDLETASNIVRSKLSAKDHDISLKFVASPSSAGGQGGVITSSMAQLAPALQLVAQSKPMCLAWELCSLI